MKKVICLYRVSTVGQVDHDDIPMQRLACREYAKTHLDWEIVDEICEKGISGYKVSATDRDAIVEIKKRAAQHGERFVCIELEIPDGLVLLSDFHMWHFVLNRWPISDTEEEANRLDKFLESAEQDKAEVFLRQNWERVFDITPFENEWTSRGDYIQSTFWELKYEYVKKVRSFSAARKWKGSEN